MFKIIFRDKAIDGFVSTETIMGESRLNIRATAIVDPDLPSNPIYRIETYEEIKTYAGAEQDHPGTVFCPHGRRNGQQYPVYSDSLICSRTSQRIYSFFSAGADRHPDFCLWLCEFLFPAPDGRFER